MEATSWSDYLSANTSRSIAKESDYGLAKIAQHFDKEESLSMYWQGVEMEGRGDIDGAIKLYRRAYKQWPALDSVTYGGLPLGVRQEALKVSALCKIIMDTVDVTLARASRVICSKGLLTEFDVADVESLRSDILAKESLLANNPENASHYHKENTFLDVAPEFRAFHQIPSVLGKMLHFATKAWQEADWSGSKDSPGPLHAITDGVPNLSIRVVEHWRYEIGGGLADPLHYDVDSILTLVALLSDQSDFEGGVFRTNEPDGKHMEHRMDKGDVICFVSHKFHNITPIKRGVRKSLVVELWQGGIGHRGR